MLLRGWWPENRDPKDDLIIRISKFWFQGPIKKGIPEIMVRRICVFKFLWSLGTLEKDVGALFQNGWDPSVRHVLWFRPLWLVAILFY